MKQITKLGFAILMLSQICSCSKENVTIDGNDQSISDVVRQKIINTAEYSDNSNILLKFSEVPTTSEIEDLRHQDGVQSVKRIFTEFEGKEELEKKYGLDRWYEIKTDNGTDTRTDIHSLALTLAQDPNVKTIQYNNVYRKASDERSFPYKADLNTRATGTENDFPLNDPLLSNQWHYYNTGNKLIARQAYKGADINVKDVWRELTTGDPSIIVAIIDEPIDYRHPDLKANLWVNEAEKNGLPGKDDDRNGYIDDVYGYNFADDQGDLVLTGGNLSGHGTHCAGTIAAVNNNNIGVAGVAGGSGNNDGARLMSCQIFSSQEGGSSACTAQAIKYAADMGASIISCSFGIPGGGFKSDDAYYHAFPAEVDAINYFEDSKNNDVLDGNIAIFASGNDGLDYASYPGALSNIISVSAFAPDYLPTYYTNYGPGCNIVAPGGEYGLAPDVKNYRMSAVLSTLPKELNKGEDYGYMQGTSMACPHVSGIAALALSYAKKLGKKYTREEFKNMIISSANDIDTKLIGQKVYEKYVNQHPLDLYKYHKKLGTGSIDTWNLMMKIEGIPSIIVEIGKNQWVDISSFFGTSSINLTYLEVEMTDEDRKALGVTEDPYIKYGRLYIHPTKTGSAKVTIKAVGGGTHTGGKDSIGGMEMSQTVSIVARPFKSTVGGWL